MSGIKNVKECENAMGMYGIAVGEQSSVAICIFYLMQKSEKNNESIAGLKRKL